MKHPQKPHGIAVRRGRYGLWKGLWRALPSGTSKSLAHSSTGPYRPAVCGLVRSPPLVFLSQVGPHPAFPGLRPLASTALASASAAPSFLPSHSHSCRRLCLFVAFPGGSSDQLLPVDLWDLSSLHSIVIACLSVTPIGSEL